MLTVTGLCTERDERALFENLSFTVNKGQLLQITGPNGAGKTTLLRTLATLYQPEAGQISFEGRSINAGDPNYCQSLLYIGHQAGIKAGLTVKENITWLCALQGGVPAAAPLREGLRALGLQDMQHSLAGSLSAGQKRKVALTRLLLTRASLWILDEPFTALDKASCDWLTQCLYQHSGAGGAVIFTSHQALTLEGITTLSLGEGGHDE